MLLKFSVGSTNTTREENKSGALFRITLVASIAIYNLMNIKNGTFDTSINNK